MSRFKLTGALVLGLLMAMLFAWQGCKKKETTGEPTEPKAEVEEQPAAMEKEGEAAAGEQEEEEEGEEAEEEEGEEAGEEAAGGGTIPDDKADLVLKLAKATMPGVKFPHKKHAEELKVECKTCHHNDGDAAACTGCHGAKKGEGGEPTFKNAAHKLCQGCHKEQKKGPTVCNKCHK